MLSCLRTIFCLLLISMFSCKPAADKMSVKDEQGGYFSVRSFAVDQWKTFHYQPYGIIKVTTLNGKTDSLYTNTDKVRWGDIFKIFFETDISDKKFLDQYDFNEFVDEMSMTNNYVYEAKDKKQSTQKLSITSHVRNNKITSIYIETLKKTFWSTHTQKLFYVPVKSIMIQDFESSLFGKQKDLKVEYFFL